MLSRELDGLLHYLIFESVCTGGSCRLGLAICPHFSYDLLGPLNSQSSHLKPLQPVWYFR